MALASSGPHTNGFTLIRDLLRQDPSLAQKQVGTGTFIDVVLEPHRCYYRALKDLLSRDVLSGMAHITGGGIKENLDRILPSALDARIDLQRYKPHAVFEVIEQWATR